ncbi:hypothetical protein J6590_074528, partial [Homalodisca vitripennis]
RPHGRHPQTYRNVSPAHTQTRKTSTEPLSPVDSRDLPFSPLISQQINKIRCIERAVQTEEECLKSKDDLLDRIAELTQRQSSLIDKIQSPQLDLEAEKIAARSHSSPEVVNVAEGCEPEKKMDFTMQTDLFIPMCEQCPVLEQTICQAEGMIEKLHLIFSELHVKYNDLRESHEQLLYLQGTETRNDDSLLLIIMFSVLGSKDDTSIANRKNCSGWQTTPNRKNKNCSKKNYNIEQKISKIKLPQIRSKSNKEQNTNKEHIRLKLAKHIHIYGDSHAKGLFQYRQEKLPRRTNVFVCSGTNDLSRCSPGNSQPALALADQIKNVVSLNIHTNWIVVSLPHRHDMPYHCHTNQEIKHVNNKLDSFATNCFKLIQLHGLRRMHFTRHGLHLNRTGKRILSNWILKAILSGNSSVLSPTNSHTKESSSHLNIVDLRSPLQYLNSLVGLPHLSSHCCVDDPRDETATTGDDRRNNSASGPAFDMESLVEYSTLPFKKIVPSDVNGVLSAKSDSAVSVIVKPRFLEKGVKEMCPP